MKNRELLILILLTSFVACFINVPVFCVLEMLPADHKEMPFNELWTHYPQAVVNSPFYSDMICSYWKEPRECYPGWTQIAYDQLLNHILGGYVNGNMPILMLIDYRAEIALETGQIDPSTIMVQRHNLISHALFGKVPNEQDIWMLNRFNQKLINAGTPSLEFSADLIESAVSPIGKIIPDFSGPLPEFMDFEDSSDYYIELLERSQPVIGDYHISDEYSIDEYTDLRLGNKPFIVWEGLISVDDYVKLSDIDEDMASDPDPD